MRPCSSIADSTAKQLLYLFLVVLLAVPLTIPAQSLLPYVQPLSGTAASTTPAAIKHGEGTEQNANTIPAVTVPFAMTQFTPQTRLTETKCVPPYFYKDTLLYGFRGTHWLSGSCVQDYGSFTIMPITGALHTAPAAYATSFSHADETASPAYYRVHLPQYGLTTEMTATPRCGIMQFTVQQDDSLYLLIMPNSDQGAGYVKVNAATGEVWGYNPVHRIYQGWGSPAGFSGYFYLQVDKAVSTSGTYSGAQKFAVQEIANQKEIGAYMGFTVKKGDKLRLRVGTSFSSMEGAMHNAAAEMPNFDFEAVVKKAQATWEAALGQVQIETANTKDKRIFYTALYHALLHPRLYSDVDGTYPAFNGNRTLQKIADGAYYDDFSMWDIYRAQLPLIQILNPSLINSLVRSLIAKGQQGGWLPIFPCWNSYTAAMIGDHATAFIATAYANGIRDYDVKEAYRLMRQNAFAIASDTDYKNGKGRRALASYTANGYIPLEDSVPLAFHKKEQVSRTLEYAYDDYALSVVAQSMGKKEDYRLLRQRAFNYKNVFDPTVGMVRGRYSHGGWYGPFQPDKRAFYITEGTPRQYTFYVPQDVAGLARLMGGDAALATALDSLFSKNEYWHGNEPGHQIPFMYNYTPTPWKTQQQVRRILSEEYSDGPGGLSGNDDAGQMSAWYVFASLGLYPVNPVSGELVLSTPLFDAITIALPNGKEWKIVCTKATPGAAYIGKATWNGKVYTHNYLQYQDIMQGGQLHLYLQATPAAWGSEPGDRPSSISVPHH